MLWWGLHETPVSHPVFVYHSSWFLYLPHWVWDETIRKERQVCKGVLDRVFRGLLELGHGRGITVSGCQQCNAGETEQCQRWVLPWTVRPPANKVTVDCVRANALRRSQVREDGSLLMMLPSQVLIEIWNVFFHFQAVFPPHTYDYRLIEQVGSTCRP